jgi:hypothetical protein
MILRHGWQPTGTFSYPRDTQVVPNWYSLLDRLRKVLSVYCCLDSKAVGGGEGCASSRHATSAVAGATRLSPTRSALMDAQSEELPHFLFSIREEPSLFCRAASSPRPLWGMSGSSDRLLLDYLRAIGGDQRWIEPVAVNCPTAWRWLDPGVEGRSGPILRCTPLAHVPSAPSRTNQQANVGTTSTVLRLTVK